MKKYIILLLTFSILAGCAKPEQLTEQTEKSPFYIQTKKIADFQNTSKIEKSGKILPSSLINMKSQSNWQVSEIYVKEWDYVTKWQILAKLSDTIASYNIKLASAANAVQRAELSLKSTEISLNKSIEDAKLNLTRAQKNYDIAKQDAEQTLKSAKNNLDQVELSYNNANLSSWTSISSLDLENLKNSLKKQELDFKNKLIADEETMNWFISSTKEKYKSLKNTYVDVINFADELYWVSTHNMYKNDAYRIYLGAKDSIVLQNTKNKIQSMLDKKDTILQDDLSLLNESNLSFSVEKLDSTYNEIIDLLSDMQHDLNNSIEGVDFTKEMISRFLQTVSWYQNVIWQKYTWYIAFKNQIKTFLSTYKKAQESIKKAIEIARQNIFITEKKLQTQLDSTSINYETAQAWFEKTSLALQDKLSSLSIALQSAKNNLNTAVQNKSITLAQLRNGIKQAQISYNEISTQAWKLTIKSPVNGKISSVKIDVWQDVFSNSPLFDIIQDWDVEIKTAFSQQELTFIHKWMLVKTTYLWKDLTWSVYSISDLANNNLSYDVRIIFDDKVKIFWDVIKLEFPIQSEKLLLPINLIKSIWENRWIIKILKNGKIEDLEITTWKSYNDKIEIIEQIDENTEVIETNVDNFDPSKFELNIK